MSGVTVLIFLQLYYVVPKKIPKKPVYHTSLDDERCCLLFLMQGQTYFSSCRDISKQHRRDNSKFVQMKHEE